MTRAAPVLLVAIAAATLGRPAPAAQEARPAAPASDALAIIVNVSNPVENLSLAELRRILLLESQTWPHGRRITVVLREPGQPERAEAVSLIAGMTEAQFERHVLFLTFRGRVGWGPRSIRSAGAMLRFVYNAPGAVGHVHVSELDGTTKVLRIGGLPPEDARYPLRRRTP